MNKKEIEKILEDCLKDADSIEKCPVCGKNTYYLYKGAHDGEQQISPSQSTCSSCGFFWSQDDELEEEKRAKEYKEKLRKAEEAEK